MAPKKAVAKTEQKTYDYSSMEKGMRLQVNSEDTWYACEVVAISTAKARSKAPIKVSYKGYEGYDEWVGGDRIRSKALQVGAPKKDEKESKPKKDEKDSKPKKDEEESKPREPVTFQYFQLWAKGPAPALALNHSGLDWKGVFPENWAELKPTTPWGHLPVLDVPGIGMIGHELTILNYIGRRSKKVGGFNMKDFTVSSQLMAEAEDIYQALGKIQPTVMAKDKPKDAVDAFWAGSDATVHNKNQGLAVFLSHLEKFHGSCGKESGKFTSSGVTIGECKLWSTLHMLKLIKDDVLTEYSALAGFYDTFGALPKTKEIVESGGKMPGAFNQYFLAAE